jgi:hypothetical protein
MALNYPNLGTGGSATPVSAKRWAPETRNKSTIAHYRRTCNNRHMKNTHTERAPTWADARLMSGREEHRITPAVWGRRDEHPDRGAGGHGGWAGVSCGSATSCVAVGGDAAAVLSGTTWSVPSSIDSATVNAVSCTSPSFCEAVDARGDAITFNGASWTSPSPALSGIPLTTVSCAAVGTCMAVGADPETMESEVVSGSPR